MAGKICRNGHRTRHAIDELEVSKLLAQELVEDLHERGQIDIRDAFMDGGFAPAKKRGLLSARHITLREIKQKYGRMVCFAH